MRRSFRERGKKWRARATPVSEQLLGYPFLHGGEEDAGAVSVNGLISSLTPAAAPGLHTAFLTRMIVCLADVEAFTLSSLSSCFCPY